MFSQRRIDITPIAIFAVVAATFLGCAVSGNAQMSQAESPIAVSIALRNRGRSAISLDVTVRNVSQTAKYITIEPEQPNGKMGYTLTQIDDRELLVDSGLVRGDPNVYYVTDQFSVELLRLEPGHEYHRLVTIDEAMEVGPTIFDPKAPPIEQIIIRKFVLAKTSATLRFQVGYFDDFEGLAEYLARRQANRVARWARVYTGPQRDKFLIDLQASASGTVELR